MNETTKRPGALWRLVRTVLYVLGSLLLLMIVVSVWLLATLYTPTPPQEGYLTLTGAKILSGEELEPQSSATLVIQDGIIIELGKDGEVELPPQSEIVDLSGYTVIPGLIDLHVHLATPDLKAGQQMGMLQMPGFFLDIMRLVPDKRRSFLNHGVTTIRDLGSEYEWIMDFRQQIRNGELEGPRLFVAGPMFTTEGGHPVVTIGVETTSDAVRLPSTPDEAHRMVRELAQGNRRVDVIKVIQDRGRDNFQMEPIPPDVLKAIVVEAHNQGLTVTAHWGTLEDLKDVPSAGVDELQHLEPRGVIEGWPEDQLKLLVERGVPISPTLAATEVVLPPEITQQLRERVREYYAAGGRVAAGSNAGMPGVPAGSGVHREIELLVKSGLPPQDALKAATSTAADVLHSSKIGAIEPGRTADLVVLNGDPIQDIQAIHNVVMVFRDGRLVVDRRNEE